MNKEEMAVKYEKMIQKITWKFVKSYKKQYSEVFSDCQFCFARALAEYDKFDPEKGGESTWVYQKLNYWMLDLYSRPLPQKSMEGRTIPLGSHEDLLEEEPKWITDLIQEVGQEATCLIQTIMDAPIEILEELIPKRHQRAKKAIQRHMVKDLGWDDRKLQTTWGEIQECLSVQG